MRPEEQQALLTAVGQFVKEQVAPLRKRVAELEQTLEQFGYCGDWSAGSEYKRGNFVSLGGSMWSCRAEATTSRPTTESGEWKLAVKRGRDARSPTAARSLHRNVA